MCVGYMSAQDGKAKVSHEEQAAEWVQKLRGIWINGNEIYKKFLALREQKK